MRTTCSHSATPRARYVVARLLFCLVALLCVALPAKAQDLLTGPRYTIHTSQGDIVIQLFPDKAPKTVANFLRYVNAGAYEGMFLHRSAPGFVVQGGGYKYDPANDNVETVATFPPVVNEFHLSNTRGTLAMAKLGGDPNSATSQWFFNLADNSVNLDFQNGGFTVFGCVADSASMGVVDRIAALPITNAGSPFDQLPVYNYVTGASIGYGNLVVVSSIDPAPGFVTPRFAVSRSDNTTRLVWGKFETAFPVWSVNANGAVSAQKTFGAVSGYTFSEITVAPNGKTVLFWKNATQRKAAFWILAPNGATIEAAFIKPYPAGYAPGHIAIDTQNKIRVSWEKIGTSTVALWTMEPTSAGTITNSYVYAPTPVTLRHIAIAVGADNRVRLLWNDTTNRKAVVWTLPTPYGAPVSGASFATPNEYRILGLAVGTDNKPLLLWKRTDNAIAVWRTNGSAVAAGKVYGPIANVAPLGIGVGADNLPRVYWGYSNGRVALWKLSADLATVTAGYTFGPIP